MRPTGEIGFFVAVLHDDLLLIFNEAARVVHWSSLEVRRNGASFEVPTEAEQVSSTWKGLEPYCSADLVEMCSLSRSLRVTRPAIAVRLSVEQFK